MFDLTRLIVLAMNCWMLSSPPLGAQTELPFSLGNDDPLKGETASPFTATASWTALPESGTGELKVTATLQPGWHIYSLTQTAGGPVRSKIVLEPSEGVELAGTFTSTTAPHITHDWPEKPELAIEQFSDTVTWTAPLKVAAGVDPTKLKLRGKLVAQACTATNCMPPSPATFEATGTLGKGGELARGAQATPPDPIAVKPGEPLTEKQPPAPSAGFERDVTLRGQLERLSPAQAKLTLTATPPQGWHVYALQDRDPQTTSKPTLIRFTQPSGIHVIKRRHHPAPTKHAGPEETVFFHNQPVTWTFTLDLPTAPAEATIGGLLGFQICADDDRGCKPPTAVQFSAALPERTGETINVSFEAAKYAQVAMLPAELGQPAQAEKPNPEEASAAAAPAAEPELSFSWVLLLAFAGGLILNLMPCVLPVIGLKILSFVEQAGRQRQQVWLLNCVYSLGILAVFLILASLAAFAKFGWGQQQSETWFVLPMIGLIFTMALSFLGVWEIPIPGFVGTSKAAKASEQEGFIGAFLKGMITTVLAVPCSGPFLGTALGATLRMPVIAIYGVFAMIALGMSTPYLLIGAFPGLLRFLPKPGNWMNLFKEILGFTLLGAVVFLFSSVPRAMIVPSIGMVVGLGVACWWIGKTPLYEPAGKIARAYLVGGLLAVAVSWVSFSVFSESKHPLPWEPFSVARLNELRQQGKTVIADFTADWCATCKFNLARAINTPDVQRKVQLNGVVALLGDFTNYPDELKNYLATLNRNSVPVLVIYPPDAQQPPIILPEWLWNDSEVLRRLDEVGPSRSSEQANHDVSARR